MIAGVDVETYKTEEGELIPELNCQNFTLGCVTIEGRSPKFFNNKKEMWNYIIDLGRNCLKNKQVLNLYGHNHMYDFLAYADYKDKNLKILCENPFIITYEVDGKNAIMFLDTMAIYGMALKKVGDIISLPKLEMPEKVHFTGELTQYLQRDVDIVIKAIRDMKDLLKSEGVNIQRLYTINQIAIQYVLKKFGDMCKGDSNYFFYNKNRNQVHFTKNRKFIHKAYRGGKVHCFKVGMINNVTYIDKNSLYGSIATKIRFPDLRTEKTILYPLNSMNKKDLLEKIGVSKALVKNKSDWIGLLPIRTPSFSYYPKPNKFLVGVWSNHELKVAEENGYEIIAIEKSVVWDEAEENPYLILIPELYGNRLKDNSEFNKTFYKNIINRHMGKLAQTRTGKELVFDDIEEADKYLENGYKMIKGLEYDVLYEKKEVKQKMKPYYAPIIPTLINAYARVEMFLQCKKIGINNLVYMDNDSIVFKGDHLHRFDIGNGLGQFKIEHINKDILIWGRKTYKIGSDMKASGVYKSSLNEEDFAKGFVETKKLVGIKGAKDSSEIGVFRAERRDFKEQLNNYNKIMDKMEIPMVLLDCDIEDITFFLDYIKKEVGSVVEE